MQTIEIPPVGLTCSAASKVIGCSEKHIYKLLKSRRLEAFVDSTGRLMISKEELYSYLRNRGD